MTSEIMPGDNSNGAAMMQVLNSGKDAAAPVPKGPAGKVAGRTAPRRGSRPNSRADSRPTSRSSVHSASSKHHRSSTSSLGGLEVLTPEAPRAPLHTSRGKGVRVSTPLKDSKSAPAAPREASEAESAALAADISSMIKRRTEGGEPDGGTETEADETPEDKAAAKLRAKIEKAEKQVRELDALLVEKEELEREVKARKSDLALGGGSAGGCGSGSLDDDAYGPAHKPVFFTEPDIGGIGAGSQGDGGGTGAADAEVEALLALEDGTPHSASSPDTPAGGAKPSTDFIKRNVELAADGAAGALAMTAEEKARIQALVGDEDESDEGEGDEGDEGEGGATADAEPLLAGLDGGFTISKEEQSMLQDINARLGQFAGRLAITNDPLVNSTPVSPEPSAEEPIDPARLAAIDAELERFQDGAEDEEAGTIDDATLKALLESCRHEQELLGADNDDAQQGAAQP